ncbi:hypothetical protein [Pararhizobium sp. DWP3-4]
MIEDLDEEIRRKPETLIVLFDLNSAQTRISPLVTSGMRAVDIAG